MKKFPLGSQAEIDWETEFPQKNSRRLDLIDKEFREGLTDAESKELAALQTEVSAYVNQRFPLPPVDQKRLDEIEARLRNNETMSHADPPQ